MSRVVVRCVLFGTRRNVGLPTLVVFAYVSFNVTVKGPLRTKNIRVLQALIEKNSFSYFQLQYNLGYNFDLSSPLTENDISPSLSTYCL